MQFEAFYVVFPKVMCRCLHVDHRMFKYQRILYGLCLVKIPTEYHIDVAKVFGLDMFYVSYMIVNGI
jgi:hypothetical protein